jgi:hypothetical protein
LKLPNGVVLPLPRRPFRIPEDAPGISISDLNADPDAHVGKSVKVSALTSCSVNYADRGEFDLSVETNSENAPSQLRISLPKDLALQIANLGIPELTQGTFQIKFPIVLEGTVTKPTAREKRHTLTATQVEFLNADGKVVSTFKPETAPKGEKPTFDDINRFPEKYVGQTHVVEGFIVGTRSADGVGVEIANKNYAVPMNLEAYTSKGLAAQVESDLPKSAQDRSGRAKITLEVKAIHGRSNKGVVGIKQLDVELEDSPTAKVMKASSDVVYPKIPPPQKANPTPEAGKASEKTESPKAMPTPTPSPTKAEGGNMTMLLAAGGGAAGLLGGALILYYALRKPTVVVESDEEAKPSKRSYSKKAEPETPAKPVREAKAPPPPPSPKPAPKVAKKPTPPPADDNPFANFG